LAGLAGKTRLATEDCPDGKWPRPAGGD
jgi:hypothetical protein